MRISDWSSDVCSSDLQHLRPNARKCYPCVRYKTSPMSRVAHPCPTGEKLAATQLASSSYRLLQGVMSDRLASPRSKVQPKTKRPRLHKVILLNDDYTPREFVVAVLKAVFPLGEGTAYRVMMMITEELLVGKEV